MSRKVLLAITVAATLGASSQFASAFPAAPLQSLAQPRVEKVTFWGRAFPYRYNWSLVRACTRYETVETSRGPVMKRVWVCTVNPRGEVVVSYRN